MLAALTRLPFGYIVINLDPIALRLGALQIHWYGLAYVLAITVALCAVLRYADDLGVPRHHVWNIFLWSAIAGLVGGRLYFVIQQPDLVNDYLKNPINIFSVWNGGMAFFGAIFGAAPTAAILAWRAGLSPWLALDLGGMFGAVGQMFGRLGNLVNGDIVGYAVGSPNLHAGVCDTAPCIAYVADPKILPWATVYLNPASFVAERGIAYQPAALYEILWNLVALAILWQLRLYLPQKVRAGAFFSLYVGLYSLSQFVLFYFRSNIFVSFLGISTLKQAQWTGIFTGIGIALFYYFVVRRFSVPWPFDREHPSPLREGMQTSGSGAKPAPAVSSNVSNAAQKPASLKAPTGATPPAPTRPSAARPSSSVPRRRVVR